jgi:hypothetical protein
MRKANHNPSPDIDVVLRRHIMARAPGINGKILALLGHTADDLDSGNGLAALGGLEGIERDVQILRSFLLLLP